MSEQDESIWVRNEKRKDVFEWQRLFQSSI